MKYKSFETERLIIQPTSDSDAKFIFELLNTPKWLTYIGDRNIKTVEDAKKYIKEKMVPQLERLGYSNYTIIRKQDHQRIGSCGLYDREGLEGIDIGFAFLPEYENKGFGYESSLEVMRLAKEVFKLNKIVAITNPDNEKSIGLLEKLGLTFEKKVKPFEDEKELLLFIALN